MKKYRMVRPVFVYIIGIISVLAFMYGLLAHGSTTGSVFETLGLALFTLSIYLLGKRFEVKA